MGRRLYVGNLPYETGETDLQDLFAQAGTVETVKVMRDMATGRARGFAFVEMSTDEEAQKAITQLNDHQLGGPSRDARARVIVARRCVRTYRKSPVLRRVLRSPSTEAPSLHRD